MHGVVKFPLRCLVFFTFAKSDIGSNAKFVQIRSYFSSVFSRIRTEHGDFIQSEYVKIRTKNNPVFGHFSRIVLKDYKFLVTIQIFLHPSQRKLPFYNYVFICILIFLNVDTNRKVTQNISFP